MTIPRQHTGAENAMKRPSGLAALLMFLAVLLAGCNGAGNAGAPATGPFTPSEVQRFDRVTTLAVLFPNAQEQALYEAIPPEDKEGQRHYSFALKAQPGMTANRHFQLVTVSWARAGGHGSRDASSTGGPNGAMLTRVVSTADGRYDIRISVSELLPAGARAASISLEGVAKALLERYRQSG